MSEYRMKTYRYVGTLDPCLAGLTALGRMSYGTFIIQIDKFAHPLSHGWHEASEADWEVINYHDD